MREIDAIDDLEDKVASLEDSAGRVGSVATDFKSALDEAKQVMADTEKMAGRLSSGIGGSLKNAFEGLIFDGKRASDVLREVGLSVAKSAYSEAINPVTKQLGNSLGSGLASVLSGVLPFAQGGAFSQGRVTPFANGGVVSGPVSFPMRGGTGLMGEAGPEAIMPLTRSADGKLGVRAEGGSRPVNVVVNVTTPDVAGFQRSQGQIATQMSRALSRGQRNR